MHIYVWQLVDGTHAKAENSAFRKRDNWYRQWILNSKAFAGYIFFLEFSQTSYPMKSQKQHFIL